MAGVAHILIVEDEPTNAELAALICKEEGHSTRQVRDGIEALKRLLEKEHFDLVLLDVLMPRMDGLDLALALREAPATASLPIIAVTGVAGSRDQQVLRSAGVDVVITKPYKPDTLRQALRQALK
ncbi:MAG: response regulator receiver and sensor-containing signal transduction histidine kinase [Cyanobacteria bacterium RYN_339]|nr:response regulator receiver and sensor-containing signal transduction histidine kinase [Cyanobacteria bacterium RYN_339]